MSIEIWNTICDEEQNQKENLITSAYQDTLNNGIIRIIQEREISFNLGDEWGSVKASISLISSLVLSKNKKVYDKMLSYISECLNNDLVRKSENNFNSLTNEEKIKSLIIKQNAFFVYRGILLFQELDPEIIMESIKKIFSELKNINTLPLGDSIGESLAIICKVHFNLINETKNLFQPFFEEILKLDFDYAYFNRKGWYFGSPFYVNGNRVGMIFIVEFTWHIFPTFDDKIIDWFQTLFAYLAELQLIQYAPSEAESNASSIFKDLIGSVIEHWVS